MRREVSVNIKGARLDANYYTNDFMMEDRARTVI